MRARLVPVLVLIGALAVCPVAEGLAAGPCGPSPCVPERCIPPETIGGISVPFDVPIWPTLLKTEFHIMPWVSMGCTRVCIPYTGKTVEIPAPCFSLKAVPVWIPWLRPLDVECADPAVCVGQ